MGDVMEVVEEISNEYAEDEYVKNPQFYERNVKEHEEEIRFKNGNLSNEIIKHIAIEKTKKGIAKDKQKKIENNIKDKFGLLEEFDLSRFDNKDIKEFILFYENNMLASTENIFRNDRAIGKESPNIRVASYCKKYDLRHNFENLYDYVVDYRNKKVSEEDRVNLIKEIDVNAWMMETLTNFIQELNVYHSIEEVWEMGIISIIGWIKHNLNNLGERERKNYYIYYAISIITEELILSLITYIVDIIMDYTGCEKIKSDLEKAIKDINIIINTAVLDKKSEMKDIFQTYAMIYYLNIIEREKETIETILKELYSLTLTDDRKPFLRVVPHIKDEKILQEYLYEHGKERYEKERMKQKVGDAYNVGNMLKKVTKVYIDTSNPIHIKAIMDEIYFYNRKIEINIGGKTKKYNMPSLARAFVKGKNIRGKETIIINLKVKRGIDCNTFGKKHYLLKNQLHRYIYILERALLKQKKNDKNYIYNMPRYWCAILEYLFERTV